MEHWKSREKMWRRSVTISWGINTENAYNGQERELKVTKRLYRNIERKQRQCGGIEGQKNQEFQVGGYNEQFKIL